MRRRKRTEVTVDFDEVWVVRHSATSVVGWCPACGAEARLLTPEAAAALAGVSVRQIYRWVETCVVHYAEEQGGDVLVCRASLPQAGGINRHE